LRWLAPMREELRFLFISGDVHLLAADAATDIQVSAVVTDKPKCVRCWQRRADVGSHPEHADLCARCVDNVEGPGEQRRWF
jgi:isoleucyl-tRNA synthetase